MACERGMKVDRSEILMAAARDASNRENLWARVANGLGASSFAEIGVFRGKFAEHILRHCDAIDRYYLVDPWRRLESWNKPANRTNEEFADIKAEALARTEFAADKRIVLQGRTTEVSSRIADADLDVAYIDGDHTLRGITIDLVRIWPKIKSGGILAGDDFCKSIWQHDVRFEPTLVFPLAVYFAEALGAKIYGLPFDQFAIVAADSEDSGFQFCDLTGAYGSVEVREALVNSPLQRIAGGALRKLKGILSAAVGC